MKLEKILNSFDKRYHSIVLQCIDNDIYSIKKINEKIKFFKNYEKITLLEKKLIRKGYYDLSVINNWNPDVYYKNYNSLRASFIKKSNKKEIKENQMLPYEKRRWRFE